MVNERVLMTGATGFLGHNLVSLLVASGYSVRALVRETSDTRQLPELGVELFVGDVRDAASVNAALAGCTYVACQRSIPVVGRGARLRAHQRRGHGLCA